jgi:hypothetical protein
MMMKLRVTIQKPITLNKNDLIDYILTHILRPIALLPTEQNLFSPYLIALQYIFDSDKILYNYSIRSNVKHFLTQFYIQCKNNYGCNVIANSLYACKIQIATLL